MRQTARDRDAAFRDFVAARWPRFFRTAYLVCGNRATAEDLVQTALARLYVAWHRVEREGTLDAYVRRSIVNAHIDETRRARSHHEVVGLGDHDLPAAAGGLSTEDSDALWTAIAALPAGQRRVVVLRHYWGLSVEETAQDLGISQGTVKSQTSDALARLRGVLVAAEHGHVNDRGGRS